MKECVLRVFVSGLFDGSFININVRKSFNSVEPLVISNYSVTILKS